jgi:hypothetical protein
MMIMRADDDRADGWIKRSLGQQLFIIAENCFSTVFEKKLSEILNEIDFFVTGSGTRGFESPQAVRREWYLHNKSCC